MPAFNAEVTLERVYREIPFEFIDDIILVDDASRDKTTQVAKNLGIRTITHKKNKGYGGNQKTCYRTALASGADVVIMLHPDYQYTPKLLVAMASLIANQQYDIVLGSRILGGQAIQGGMPIYKYLLNRMLTLIQNLATGAKLSEYHTGYRAFSAKVLASLPLLENSDDFVFDNQVLIQAIYFGFSIGEITCPASYFDEASSINLKRSIQYGLGVLWTTLQFLLQKSRLTHFEIFSPAGQKITPLKVALVPDKDKTS